MRCRFFSRLRATAKKATQAAVVAGAMAGAARADTIAVNFQGDAYGALGQAVTQTAFGVAAGDWTTTDGAVDGGTIVTVVDGVTLSSTFANDWAQGSSFNATGATGDDEVYFGYLDDGASGADITITELGAWLAAQSAPSYSVTLLLSTGQGTGATLIDTPLLVADGGASLGTFAMVTEPAHSGPSGALQGLDTITGLTNDTLFIDGQIRSGAARGSIAGVIITAVPEPSSFLLVGLAALGLVAVRRRK